MGSMTTFALAGAALALALALPASAKDGDKPEDGPSASGLCRGLPSHAALQTALKDSTRASGGPTNGGLDFHMWATIVDRDGIVCAVAFTGQNRGAQWPGSRVISAQKAHAANAFSLDGLALSTANLYAATQPGGTLYGLEISNPVDPKEAYAGNPQRYGQPNDPMVGRKVGGVNVFGGGLGLYQGGKIVGGLGVSGDTSCADHNVAWRVRQALGLPGTGAPPGVSPNGNDGIVYDLDSGTPGGFGHPVCSDGAVDVAEQIGAGVRISGLASR